MGIPNPVTERITSCAANAVDEMESRNLAATISRDEKAMASRAVFQELHLWSAEHVPMGASAAVSDAFIRKGLGAVQNKFRVQKDLAQQKYGCDPVTILTVLSAMFSIISHIVQWWRGSHE